MSVPAILQALALSALLLWLYHYILGDLINDWLHQSSFTHALLVPPLALYIAWLRRDQVLRQPARADAFGLVIIAAGCAMFSLGVLGSEFFLCRFSFVVQVTGLIWTFWGGARCRALAFPLVLLASAIPLPALVYQRLTAPLQLFASSIAAWLASSLGVAVTRDGNILHLARVSLSVSEPCSGLNSLAALITTSLLLGNLLTTRLGARLLLLAFSVPLAIGTNILRLTGTAVVADYHLDLAMGFYHLFSGWLVFVVSFVLLYGASKLAAKVLD